MGTLETARTAVLRSAVRVYSVLYVRTATDLGESPERPASDLTARARIRDAAVECFAEDGFGASVRTIAARAGVSPGLVTHHFGTKDALRAECDDEVLRRYKDVKTDAVARPTDHLLESLTQPGVAASLLVYILRVIHDGGAPARNVLDRLVDDTRAIMADGVARGMIRPSRDEEARLRYLTYQTMGALLIEFTTGPATTPAEFVATLRSGATQGILPTLELFTEGLLTSRELLDGYLGFLWEPPNDGAAPASDA